MSATVRSRIAISVRLAPELGTDGRAYRMTCPHGATTGAFLPGRRTLPDHVVRDLLAANHQAARSCTCLPLVPVA